MIKNSNKAKTDFENRKLKANRYDKITPSKTKVAIVYKIAVINIMCISIL